DLGMITTTQALRLKHALELVTHFANAESDGEGEGMNREEAVALLRACVTSILGKPQFDAAVQFTAFRRRLVETSLKNDDSDLIAISESPYFFKRTTLSILLAAVKGSQGAKLEHVVRNI